MLDQLEDLLSAINQTRLTGGLPAIAFGYGTDAELNVLADSITSSYLLFHEGLFQSGIRLLPSGALEYAHQLSLVLYCPSSLSDKASDARANKDLLKPIMEALFIRLDKLGTVQGARMTMNLLLKRTDRNLDGIRLSLQLTPEPLSLC